MKYHSESASTIRGENKAIFYIDGELNTRFIDKKLQLFVELYNQKAKIFVIGNLEGSTGNTAFLVNDCEILSLRNGKILLEVDGVQDWFSPKNIETLTFITYEMINDRIEK